MKFSQIAVHVPSAAHMLQSMLVVGALVTLVRATLTVHCITPLIPTGIWCEFDLILAKRGINSKGKAVDQFYIS